MLLADGKEVQRKLVPLRNLFFSHYIRHRRQKLHIDIAQALKQTIPRFSRLGGALAFCSLRNVGHNDLAEAIPALKSNNRQ